MTEAIRVAELAEVWWERGEPEVTCPGCGHAARLGDWDNLCCVVGGFAVSF